MGYIGGALQERFVQRVRGVDPGRLLAVPIDVGKHSAAALVSDLGGGGDEAVHLSPHRAGPGGILRGGGTC